MAIRPLGLRLSAMLLAVALLFAAGAAQAVPTLYTDTTSYLAAITPNFTVDVGRDQAGILLPNTSTVHDGGDIFVAGPVDVDFSSDGVGISVSVNSGHPELGPYDGANFWSGPLRIDFSNAVTAIGFGMAGLAGYNLELLDENGEVQWSGAAPGGIFNGIVDTTGFYGLVIDTTNTFWSLDGGPNLSGPASATQMVGTVVPEPSTVALLGLGLGLLGLGRRLR